MRNSGLLFLVFAAAMTVFALPMWPGTHQSETGPGSYGDPDAYEVYSAAIPLDRWYWQNSRTLLIFQEIPPKEWPIGPPRGALHGDAEFTKTFGGIFKSFEEANKRKTLLEPRLAIQKPYKIVTNAELDAAFHRRAANAVDDGWEGFRQTYPDSDGYMMILSGVGFNPEKTVALVYVEHRCGGLCGMAHYYILEKRNGRWVKYNPKGLESEMTGNS